MNKTSTDPNPAPRLPDPVTTSSWPFLALVLVASAGLARPALATDPSNNAQGVQLTQDTGSAPSQVFLDPQTWLSQASAPDLTSDIQLAQANAGQGALQGAIGGGQPSPSAQTGPNQATPPVAGAGGGGGGGATYSLKPPPPGFKNPYALADSLKYRGWIVPLPGALETLDQGLLGIRNTLAQNGISYFGFSTTTFQDNIIRHGLPAGNQFGPHSRDLQSYAGQLPTYTTANTIFLMYDLAQYGIPDGQVSVSGSILQTNWQPGDPNGINLGQLSYYQTAFNRLLEIKVGYLTNNLEYLGTQIGGNIGAGLFGVSAAIPFEEGQNLGSFPTPSANVKVNLPDHFYTKLGVQRGTSPDGLQTERLENPSSVRFVGPNDGVVVIDETGYRVNAAPGQMSTWIRGAANYTSSRYVNFSTGERQQPNYGLYLLGDRQIIKTAPRGGPRTAFDGLYVGFSAMFAPKYLNAFSQYYEGRIYGFGLIPGRPFDLASFAWDQNVFSKVLVNEGRFFGQLTHTNANTFTGSYNFRVVHGVNVAVGLSYTDHPVPITYTSNSGSSLSVLTNLFIWL